MFLLGRHQGERSISSQLTVTLTSLALGILHSKGKIKKNRKPGICISICQTVKERIGCNRTCLVTTATSPYTLPLEKGGPSLGFLSQSCTTPKPIGLRGLLPHLSWSRHTKHPVYLLQALGGSCGTPNTLLGVYTDLLQSLHAGRVQKYLPKLLTAELPHAK